MINLDFFDSEALLDRLSDGVLGPNAEVVFLIGAALSAPEQLGVAGVPLAAGIIDLIGHEFSESQFSSLRSDIDRSTNPYQAAFTALSGRRGQNAVNKIVRSAVMLARTNPSGGSTHAQNMRAGFRDDECALTERSPEAWHLPAGTTALGELATRFPGNYGKTVLTTNFDPLLEVSIARAGGPFYRTTLHGEGDLSQTQGTGCHIVHLHGFWYGTDTLHTPRQLGQPRPRLRASLAHIVSGRTLVVIGYGGWDDIVTRTLVELAQDDKSCPEILWTFRDENPLPANDLFQRMMPGIDRGRINFYRGIDCNVFLPKLLGRADGWRPRPSTRDLELATVDNRPKEPLSAAVSASPVGQPTDLTRPKLLSVRPPLARLDLARGQQDHPPVIDVYVGRAGDLSHVTASASQAIFLTGIGGQGKSALAARYYQIARDERTFDYYCWRDCKEEADRFEGQIVSLILGLSPGLVKADDLAGRSIEELSDILINISDGLKGLIVFDNVDYYFDVELRRLTGSAGRFIDRLLAHVHQIRVLFTCRPEVESSEDRLLHIRLQGLELLDCSELFKRRGASASDQEIYRAHQLTQGHALWLDLLAGQVVHRQPRVALGALLDEFASDTPELPTITLNSIWAGLNEREREVLRCMAEAVRPTTAYRLSDYLGRRVRYHQIVKALGKLRNYNLIVVKNERHDEASYELHPLIRTFMRRSFTRAQREPYIRPILNFYIAFFGSHRAEISGRPDQTTLEHWTEGAELHVEAGDFPEAFECLYEVARPLRKSDNPGEFSRVAKLLLDKVDWSTYAQYPNFDELVAAYVEARAIAGDQAECKNVFERYLDTLSGKTARYVNFCNMNAFVSWQSEDFVSAIKWGQEGLDIKIADNLDTKFDTGHNLALARRDSGAIQPALEYFLGGQKLTDVTKPGQPDASKSTEFYGNIGRCLQLRGQRQAALTAYKKSGLKMEASDSEYFENGAYLRQWVGETLLAEGDVQRGLALMDAALARWELISPRKAYNVRAFMDASTSLPPTRLPAGEAERAFKGWLRS